MTDKAEPQDRFKELEDEAKKIKEAHASMEKTFDPAEKAEVDSRSIHVGNVDYSTTVEDLQSHFQSCGSIKRVTIICDKQGQPKGFAYIEFQSPESVKNSEALNQTLFKGRVLQVTPKRTNVPQFVRGRGRGRGSPRGMRGGGRGIRARGGRGRGHQPY